MPYKYQVYSVFVRVIQKHASFVTRSLTKGSAYTVMVKYSCKL